MTEQTLSRFFEVYPDIPGATIPLGYCVDDLVYACALAGTDPVSGAPADGLIEQTQIALGKLKALIEGAGASLDNIGRAVAHVTRIEDRDAIYGPWDAMFPDAADRPAFKVLVGALPAGHLVHIDGLAVMGQRRERTDIDGVSARDPSVRVGDWLFTSRVHGHIPHEGVPKDPLDEALQTFRNIAALLDKSGFASSDLAQMTLFCTDARYFAVAQSAYEQTFPDPALRPRMEQLISFIVPRFKFSVEMVARRGLSNAQQAFREIYLCPDRRPIPSGVKLGPLVIAADLTSADPCSCAAADGDSEAHLGAAMANMKSFLAAAGTSINSVTRATFYMPNVDDRTAMNAVWSSYFPEEKDRPPHKYAPSALPAGNQVLLQVLALPGLPRRTLEIPGIKHMDWMSMGAATGNLVTSSRLFGTHAFTGKRAADAVEATQLAFGHASTLLAEAGSDRSRVCQVNAFIADPIHRDIVIAEFNKFAKESAGTCRLNIINWHWASGGTPRIEIVAL